MSKLDTGFKSVETEEEAIIIVRSQPSIIASLPDDVKTEEVFFIALSSDFAVYDLVDDIYLTDSLITRLLLDNEEALTYIPPHLVKHHHCLEMVKSNGRAVRFVPERILSSDICNAAVDNDPSAHEFIPMHLQDSYYVNRLIKQSPEYVTRIDIAQRDSNVLKEVVETTPEILRFMAMPDRTFKICEIALKQRPELIEYFPEDVYNNKKMLKILSELDMFKVRSGRFEPRFMRKSLAVYMFEKYPEIFRFLPIVLIDKEMAIKAIKLNPLNVICTPAHLKTSGELWEIALSQKPELYEQIPDEELNDAIRIFIARKKAMSANESLMSHL